MTKFILAGKTQKIFNKMLANKVLFSLQQLYFHSMQLICSNHTFN